MSALSSFLFGAHIAIVLLAFFGACCALMISEKDRSFLGACMFVVVSSVSGTLGATGITFLIPGFPERLSAFLIAVIALPFLRGMIDIAKSLPEKARDKWL